LHLLGVIADQLGSGCKYHYSSHLCTLNTVSLSVSGIDVENACSVFHFPSAPIGRQIPPISRFQDFPRLINDCFRGQTYDSNA
jgi:hypothetical protein